MKEVIGSQILPRPEEMTITIQNLRNKIEELKKELPKKIDEYVNLYTAYTVLLCFAGSGHRPVVDPFCYRSDIDLENGLAIINDKVPTVTHKNRLVALSDEVCKQLKEYIINISSLAQYIVEIEPHSILASQIQALLDPEVSRMEQPIPFLFFISKDMKYQELSSENFKKVLGPYWKYPLNVFRGIIETNSISNGVNNWIVDMQMGHLHGNEHHLSASCSCSPIEALNTMRESLNKIMIQYNWKAIAGFDKSHGYEVRVKYGRDSSKLLFGPEGRERERIRKLVGVRRFVELMLEEKDHRYRNGSPAFMLEENQKKIREKINVHYQGKPDHAILAHKIFTRKIKNNGLNDSKFKSIAIYQHPLRSAASPIYDGWLVDLRKADLIKHNFGKYLNYRNNSEIDIDRRWAEIIISSIIGGGLINKCALEFLLDRNRTNLVRIQSIVFFDIYKDNEKDGGQIKPDFRFQLDPLTKNLVQGLHKQKGFENIEIGKVKRALVSIGQKLGIEEASSDAVINELINRFSSYWFYQLPPFLYAIASGKQSTTPLPLSTLKRLITKKVIKSEAKEISNVDLKTYFSIFDASPEVGRSINAKKIISDIRKIIKNVVIDEREKNESSEISVRYKIRRERLKKILQALTDHFEKGREKTSINVSETGQCVIDWIAYLCRVNIDRGGKPLSTGSIDRYFSCLNILLNRYYDEKFLGLDQDEYTEVYKSILESCEDKRKNYRAHVLRRFHRFLEERDGVEPADWSEMNIKWDEDYQANANVITNHEYKKIIDTILSKDFPFLTERYQIGTLFILGYRFGLRLGEALQLRWTDIQIGKNNIILQVQKHRLDKLKTEYSVRQIYAFEMTDTEISILMEMKNAAQRYLGNEKKSLFIGHSDRHSPMSRDKLSDKVHRIMRHVCRDDVLVFHHLRHSAANNLFNAIFLNDQYASLCLYQSGSRIRCKLFSNKPLDNRGLRAISGFLGHGLTSTSIDSYIHLTDLSLVSYAQKTKIQTINSRGIAYVCNSPQSTIERYLDRASISRESSYEYFFRKKNNSLPKKLNIIGDRDKKFTAEESSQAFKVTMLKVDNMLREYSLHRRVLSLATNHSCSFDQVLKLIDISESVELESGYRIFNINDSQGMLIKQNKKPSYASYNTEISNLLSAYSDYEEYALKVISEYPDLICRAYDAWKGAYELRASRERLNFTFEHQLQHFFELLLKLKFKPEWFSARTFDLQEEERELINFKMETLGVGSYKNYPYRNENLRIHGEMLQGVKISLIPNQAKFNYTRTLNRFLYIFFCTFFYIRTKSAVH